MNGYLTMRKRDNYIMMNVEVLVCEGVSEALASTGRAAVSVEDLYAGTGNIPVCRSVARGFVFDIFHNKYGFSYSVISQRAGMVRESIMRSIRKSRHVRRSDSAYSAAYEHVLSKLRDIYGK